MSAIARLQKAVIQIQKRRSQSIHATSSHDRRKVKTAKGDKILAAALESIDRQDEAKKNGSTEDVMISGTGKAIAKVLGIAAWLQDHAEQEGVKVRLETGSTITVDDIDVEEVEEEGEEAQGMEVDAKKDEEEVPESRLRTVSVLHVKVQVL